MNHKYLRVGTKNEVNIKNKFVLRLIQKIKINK